MEELVLDEAEENVWATQFRSFLRQRDKSLEHALDFVTLSSRLSALQDQAKYVVSLRVFKALSRVKLYEWDCGK